MKIKLTTPHKLLLAISVFLTLPAHAEPNNECQNQSLSPKGLAVSGNTITPGQNVTISLVSDKGKPEATVVLKLKKMKNAIVVNGEIKNIGSCELSTHMPVSLYPIKNGLPLGWHSLPEGVELSNPALKPGRFVKFYKEYSIDYAGGFNLKVGTFNISPSNETVENNADACSDKAIAKQLELLADKESKNEMDTCQSAQVMNRLNEAMLGILNKCTSKSKERELLRKEIKQNIVEYNQDRKNSCQNFPETKLARNDAVSSSNKTPLNCPTTFKDKDWGEKEYAHFFEQISRNKVHIEYGREDEIDYPWRVYTLARFTNKIDPLKDRNWQSWSKSEWSIVLGELQGLQSNMPDKYPNSGAYVSSSDKQEYMNYLEKQIQGVKCYASSKAN